MEGQRHKPKPWNKRGHKGGQKGKSFAHDKKKSKRAAEDEEIRLLTEKICEIDPTGIEKFTDFPLCHRTQLGLKEAKYQVPTDIQKESIGLALQGNDILGAAKTGSGKTLAFLIPVLEKLFHQKWTAMDGLGALIISPTRELAYQIFEVLRKVGRYHDFSAGLVIGGKNVQEEAQRINKTNIVICTPGRLLQHMDETAFFVADNLQILVLDEADRILDLGFQRTMNAIIENLPPTRQTLLFSATQTKSVKDLARLSLKDPIYVSVHEKAANSTPSQLQQSYIVCELHDKLTLLWSFIKQHLHRKVLVFIASCKQVRFVFESLRRLKPGMTVLALHGGMKQMKRMEVYEQFCRKQHAVLLATDIAARGLDFPAVHWVLQLDCPEDANTYIHRAGRTARYETDGEALLVLTPSQEDAMVTNLQAKKIPIEKIKVNPRKVWDIQKRLESLCASDVTMKEFAQRAFVAYLKHVYFQKDKLVFDISKIDLEKFATSLGLAVTPRVRFLEKQQKMTGERLRNVQRETPQNEKRVTNKGRSVAGTDSEASDDGESGEEETSAKTVSSSLKSSAASKKHQQKLLESDDEVMDDLFKVKKTEDDDEEEETSSDEEDSNVAAELNAKKPKKVSKAALVKKLMKKNIQVNTKVCFDDEGNEVLDPHKKSISTKKAESDESESEEETGGIDINKAHKRLREEDTHDKELYRQKIKQKHREQRLKEKMKRRKQQQGQEEDSEEVQLGGGEEEQEEEGYESPEIPDLEKYYGSGSDDDEGDDDDDHDDDDEDDDVEEYESVDDSDTNAVDDESDDDTDSDENYNDQSSDEEVSRKKIKLMKKDTEVMDTGLSLQDDEEIALRLLGQ